MNILKQRKGVDAIFRVISPEIPTLDRSWIAACGKTMTDHHQGLVLVTGPSGCGKTTTLAAMIDYINSHKKVHVVTLEDPIEYIHYK